MATLNIVAIRARAEGATPEPKCWDAFGPDHEVFVERFGCDTVYGKLGYAVISPTQPTSTSLVARKADWEFFCHARADVLALCAEVKRLRAKISQKHP